MANEIEAHDEAEIIEEDLELEEEKPEEKPEAKEKVKLTPEQQLAIHKREIKKLEKSLGVSEEKPQLKEKASSDLDYGQLAFLRSYDVKGSDELALVKAEVKRSGLELHELIENPYFTQKLTDLREARAVKDATPKGTKRSVTPAQDDLQVALGKYKESGNLPEEIELRRKVLNAAIANEKEGGRFASTSVIMAGNAL